MNENQNSTLITKINLIVDKDTVTSENNHREVYSQKLNDISVLSEIENETKMKRTYNRVLKKDFLKENFCFKNFFLFKKKNSAENVCIVENTHL